MNGNINTLDIEMMVSLEMDDIRREMESIRLLREARISNPGWLERTFIAIGNALIKRGQQLHEAYTTPQPAYRTSSGKLTA
jgi:hypothetical protein